MHYLPIHYQMRFNIVLIITIAVIGYKVDSLKTSTYVRALDKVICEFLGKLKPEHYSKLCDYIECYNNCVREFVEKLKDKDLEFRRMAIVHCDWGEPEFPKYHDRLWYEVWMEWNVSYLDRLDLLVNTTQAYWGEYKGFCEHSNYSTYLDRFHEYSNSSEILMD